MKITWPLFFPDTVYVHRVQKRDKDLTMLQLITKQFHFFPDSVEMAQRQSSNNPSCYYEVTNHPDQLSLAILPWIGATSTRQRAVMHSGSVVKACTACVWCQVELCNPLQDKRHYPSALVDLMKCYIKFTLVDIPVLNSSSCHLYTDSVTFTDADHL